MLSGNGWAHSVLFSLSVRGGHVSEINASELVVGDIVQLEEGTQLITRLLLTSIKGDQVPADVRLVHTSHLQIDESTLTGESAPVDKTSKTLKKPSIS